MARIFHVTPAGIPAQAICHFGEAVSYIPYEQGASASGRQFEPAFRRARVTSICRDFSQKIICATASFACIGARMFWDRHKVFPTKESIVSEKEKMLSVMQEIFSVKEKMPSVMQSLLSVKEKILSVPQSLLSVKEKMLSVMQEILSAREKISSVKESIFCIPDSTFSVTNKIFSLTNTMLGEGKRSLR